MAKEVTKSRYIKEAVRFALWGRSAGRCQFNSCNRPLYKSPITHETANIAEAAHIYSFSSDGPRGWGLKYFTNQEHLNNIDNLMLMCHDCHKTIDQDKDGSRYSAELLQRWKREHEERIWSVASIKPTHKSHAVFYGANIGEQKSPIQKLDALSAMFPKRFPANEEPVKLSMHSTLKDKDASYWQAESEHLQRVFERKITPLIEEAAPAHFSLFALAPMPLLIKLGALFTDKLAVETYQPIREPRGWQWQPEPNNFGFKVLEPENKTGRPALILSLSAEIDHCRITSVLDGADIWVLSTPPEHQHNDFIRSPQQLSEFRKVMRQLLERISQAYNLETPLALFPAIPVSCAIELGRLRMPKSSMPWVVYDHNDQHGKFIETIEIKECV